MIIKNAEELKKVILETDLNEEENMNALITRINTDYVDPIVERRKAEALYSQQTIILNLENKIKDLETKTITPEVKVEENSSQKQTGDPKFELPPEMQQILEYQKRDMNKKKLAEALQNFKKDYGNEVTELTYEQLKDTFQKQIESGDINFAPESVLRMAFANLLPQNEKVKTAYNKYLNIIPQNDEIKEADEDYKKQIKEEIKKDLWQKNSGLTGQGQQSLIPPVNQETKKPKGLNEGFSQFKKGMENLNKASKKKTDDLINSTILPDK